MAWPQPAQCRQTIPAPSPETTRHSPLSSHIASRTSQASARLRVFVHWCTFTHSHSPSRLRIRSSRRVLPHHAHLYQRCRGLASGQTEPILWRTSYLRSPTAAHLGHGAFRFSSVFFLLPLHPQPHTRTRHPLHLARSIAFSLSPLPTQPRPRKPTPATHLAGRVTDEPPTQAPRAQPSQDLSANAHRAIQSSDRRTTSPWITWPSGCTSPRDARSLASIFSNSVSLSAMLVVTAI